MNNSNDDINQALQGFSQDLALERLDWTNPACTQCKMHQEPKHLYNGLCAECADTAIQIKTGCRFGTPGICTPLTHSDCFF